MAQSLLFRKIILTVLLAGFTLFSLSSATFAENETDMEVLTRGPVHEAFAGVSVDETGPGLIISSPVPDPINEIPPEFRPEGNRVEWIPGYWSWDDDQNNFIWVSGIWRDVPPDRQWIPGYWQAVTGGNQYISGYWTENAQPPTVYLPPPPQSLQTGPSSPASAANFVWIEGNWLWLNNSYAWQAGYWQPQRLDMAWIPAHYVWTPRGHIFVMGYWDYQPVHRGVMFAPIYYPRPIYRQHGYYYRPHIVLDTDAVVLSLFIRNSRHYYFGDYYDRNYEKRGFRPWYSQHATRYGHDPFYRSYRTQRMRDDQHWENNYRKQFEYRRDHKNARPPHRFKPAREHTFNKPQNPASRSIGRLFSNVMENKAQSQRFTRVTPDNEREFRSQRGKHDTFRAERRNFERAPHAQGQTKQPADIRKSERTDRSAAPGRSKPEKTDYVKPPKKLKESDNRRVKRQEMRTDQFQTQQQNKQSRKPQIKTERQSQPVPQAKTRYNTQVRSGAQPQILPQDTRRARPQAQTTGRVQGSPKGNKQLRQQDQNVGQLQEKSGARDNRRIKIQGMMKNQFQTQQQEQQTQTNDPGRSGK